MSHKSRDAIEAGRALCDRWARDFDLRSGYARTSNIIRQQLREDAKGKPGPRQAMALMDFVTCVTVLVHYGERGKIGPLKIKDVHIITRRKQSHREYWRALERASLVMMGYELASPLGVPARDMALAHADGSVIPLDATQIAEIEERKKPKPLSAPSAVQAKA